MTDIAELCERLLADVNAWPFTPEATSTGPRRPQDMASDLRALLLDYQERGRALERLRGALGGIKWRSVCKDNMEFSATITCWQMDAIRAALTGEDAEIERLWGKLDPFFIADALENTGVCIGASSWPDENRRDAVLLAEAVIAALTGEDA